MTKDSEISRKEVLRISHYILQTKVLGPFLRSALWVSGCPFQCEGCLAKEMNERAPVCADTSRLAELFATVQGTEGITISGGEPFEQAQALAKLLKQIRAKRDYGVIIYTGYTIEELQEKKEAGIRDLLSQTDLLIDGRYQISLDDGQAYRGSSNQRILPLSDRNRDVWEPYYHTKEKRKMEIRVENGKLYMIGVPSENGLNTWRELRQKMQKTEGIDFDDADI